MKRIKFGLIFLFVLILLIGTVSASLFGYNSGTGVTVGGSENNTYYINNSYFNVTGGGTQGVNLTQQDNTTIITIKESWLVTWLDFTTRFNALFRNWFNQSLNTTDSPTHTNMTLTGNFLCNATACFSFEELNASTSTDLSNYYTKAQVDNNFSNYYVKSEIDANLSLYYTKLEVDSNLSLYYTKTQSDANWSLYYLQSNPSNFWNFTTYNNCSAGDYPVNLSRTGFDCLTLPTASGDNESWNESYAATLFTNQSYVDTVNSTIVDWVIATFLKISDFLFPAPDNLYLYNDSTTLFFNETKMNESIESLGLQLGFNVTGSGLSSTDVNSTINTYLGNANASYLSTYNKTYDDYRINVSTNWTAPATAYAKAINDSALHVGEQNKTVLHCSNITGIDVCNLVSGLSSQQVNDSIIKISSDSKFNSTYNSTYDAYKSNVSTNYTTNTVNYLINTYNATWSSTYNSTYAASVANNTFNQSVTDDLYIQKTNESNLNVNKSNFWGNSSSANATQFDTSKITLSLLWTWFVDKWNELFRNYFNQDLNSTATPSFVGVNISGNYFYNNSGSRFSFEDLNRTGSNGGLTSQEINDSIIKTSSDSNWNSTYNTTYDAYKTNVSTNWTKNAEGYTDAKITSLSNTTIARTGNCPDGQVVMNTTNLGVQCVAQSGGLSSQEVNDSIVKISVDSKFNSTYNKTYDDYKANVSTNYTTNTVNYITTTYNATWSSTYNSSYASYVFWNYTTYTNCSAGTYAVNFSRAGFQCLAASASGVDDYTNIALTNQSNIFNNGANITVAGNITATGSIRAGNNITSDTWIHGLFDFVLGLFGVGSVNNKYLLWNGSTLSFNETNLNLTIGAVANISATQISNVINSTSNWMGVNDSRLMTINTSANFQTLAINTNLTVNNMTIVTNFSNQGTVYAGNITYYPNGCYRKINVTGIYDIC